MVATHNTACVGSYYEPIPNSGLNKKREVIRFTAWMAVARQLVESRQLCAASSVTSRSRFPMTSTANSRMWWSC